MFDIDIIKFISIKDTGDWNYPFKQKQISYFRIDYLKYTSISADMYIETLPIRMELKFNNKKKLRETLKLL